MTDQSFGRYRVQSELGRGAMGVVYRGYDPALDRPVAIKVIAAREAIGSLATDDLETRFLREAKVAARINHPGVVTVFDAGREGDSLFLVMELVEGESLAARMAAGRHPAPGDALEMAARVAEALAAAHALGVVHRDVKPANILITHDERAKVTDFGVAKAIGEATDLTRSGTVVGSPAYMAPEQVRGEPIDGRADVFSLGVVLYEMLLRRRPFPADTLTTLIFQILHDDPFADPATLRPFGEEVAAFLRACLAKTPAERVPDALTFARRAHALAAGVLAKEDAASPTAVMPLRATAVERTSPTRAVAVGPPPPPLAPRRAVPVLPLAILAGGMLAVVVALVLARRPAPPAGEVLAQATAIPVVMTEPSPPPPEAPASPTPTPAPPTPAPTATAWPDIVPAVYLPEPTAVPPPPPTPTATPTPDVVDEFVCAQGAEFNVSPEEAEVEIDGVSIGIADDWDGAGGGKVYMFERPGTYYARFSLAGYQPVFVRIVVSPGARTKIADVDTELKKVPKPKKPRR